MASDRSRSRHPHRPIRRTAPRSRCSAEARTSCSLPAPGTIAAARFGPGRCKAFPALRAPLRGPSASPERPTDSPHRIPAGRLPSTAASSGSAASDSSEEERALPRCRSSWARKEGLARLRHWRRRPPIRSPCTPRRSWSSPAPPLCRSGSAEICPRTPDTSLRRCRRWSGPTSTSWSGRTSTCSWFPKAPSLPSRASTTSRTADRGRRPPCGGS
mmetsp:Transcript_12089/g.44858  ORF Transcript_12089/g.44858 Transcript_12089/m.44858 type:complete len:215 (+) Transcript_12089:1619-2263(+)